MSNDEDNLVIKSFKTEMDIEFVSDEEQEEISKILNDPSCYELSGYEKIIQKCF